MEHPERPKCSRCRTSEVRASGQRYCRECHAAHMRGHRLTEYERGRRDAFTQVVNFATMVIKRMDSD